MKLLLFIAALFGMVDAAKILFVGMDVSPSHLSSMLAYGQRLTNNDRVIIKMSLAEPKSFNPVFEPRMTMLKSPELEEKGKEFEEQFAQMQWNADYASFMMYFVWDIGSTVFDIVLTNQSIDFWHTANETFDLLVIDSLFAVEGITQALYHKFHHSTPYIIFHTSHMEPPMAKHRQLFWSDVTAPPLYLRHATGGWDVSNLFDRIWGFVDSYVYRILYDWIVEYKINSLISPIVGKFSFQDNVQGSELSMVDYFDRIDWPAPRSRQQIHAGAYCAKPKPLPKDIEAFVNDTDSKGTIIVAFGNNVNWANTAADIVDKFVNIMSELKEFRILWGYNGPELSLPKHIRTSKWLPQTDLLYHPKTKLFFSHGGLKSVKEVVCAEVPVIYMPLFAEQVRNAFLARKHGFGAYVNKKDIVVDDVVSKIRRLTSSQSAYDNVKKAKALYMDRIMDSLDEALFWTHKLIKNASNLSKFLAPKPKAAWTDDNYLSLCMFWACLVWVAAR